jgi:hypothetical protein
MIWRIQEAHEKSGTINLEARHREWDRYLGKPLSKGYVSENERIHGPCPFSLAGTPQTDKELLS